jgi:hypothetical protein
MYPFVLVRAKKPRNPQPGGGNSEQLLYIFKLFVMRGMATYSQLTINVACKEACLAAHVTKAVAIFNDFSIRSAELLLLSIAREAIKRCSMCLDAPVFQQ